MTKATVRAVRDYIEGVKYYRVEVAYADGRVSRGNYYRSLAEVNDAVLTVRWEAERGAV